MGRGYIIILKLRGLGDLFLSEGRLIMSERSKVQDKTCYLNGHFRQVTLTSLCLMAPKVPDVCLRKPRLQEETSSILGALAEDKSLSHCPASMAQVRVTTWRGGITKTPRFPSRDRGRNLGVRSKLPPSLHALPYLQRKLMVIIGGSGKHDFTVSSSCVVFVERGNLFEGLNLFYF